MADESAAPSAAATKIPSGLASSGAVFQAAINDEIVVMGQIVQAKVMASPQFTTDAVELEIGQHYCPLLLAAFQKSHKGAQFVIQEDVGCGVVLHAADQDDPAGDKTDWAVIRKTIRFDWTRPRALLIESQALAEEARRWLRNPSERRDLLGSVYEILQQIAATIGRENRLRDPSDNEGTDPSEHIERDLEIIQRQLDAARQRFQNDVERAAQVRYARGMVIGAAVTLAISGIVMAILAVTDTPIINAVGLAAGAVGAFVSVLERMTRGKLELNAQSGDNMLMAFGALRPVVGGISGSILYLIIRAGLLSIFVLPATYGAALAYVGVFGFVAGFSERFAQDVLAIASNRRRDD